MAIKKNTSNPTKPAAGTASPGKAPAAAAPARAAAPVSSTPVRNTPIPKPVAIAAPAPVKKVITQDMIAKKAFEISQSSLCGSEQDNWFRAERELRGV